MFRIDQTRHLQNRKIFRRLAVGSALVALGAVAWARFIEPKTLLVRRIELAVPGLPAALSGIRIGFLSDFHFGGKGNPLPVISRALSVLETERPDLILLGGDYFDRGIRVDVDLDWGSFGAIAPTLAVLGNHDYHANRSATLEIQETLSNAGITVLRNQSCSVPLRNGAVHVIGLDDPYTGRANYEAAVSCGAYSASPRIVLAHAGLIADQLPLGAADLILSGHTHNGQIRISPFHRTTPLDSFWWIDRIKGNPITPYRQGLFRVRGSMLYTGNGLGTTSLDMRFLAPPELALITFVAGDGNPDRACDDAERYVLKTQKTLLWR